MSRGGARPGAGRPIGSVNKLPNEIREAAKAEGPAVLRKLLKLTKSKDERVVLAACNAILDRGYGRPPQGMEIGGRGGGNIVVEIVRFTDIEEQAADEAQRADGANGAADSSGAPGQSRGFEIF